MSNTVPNHLLEYIRDVFKESNFPISQIRNFYEQLYSDFNPDINGYTLLFMIPPDLSGYRTNNGMGSRNQAVYGLNNISFFTDIQQLIPFAAVDFTPPQYQVNTEAVNSRSGGIPYATEVAPTEQMSVTYIETTDLKIYTFHSLWVRYIKAITDGLIRPADEYTNPNSSRFGAIDYAASFYVVKFLPDMNEITFVAKCIGCFPQNIPNKELIGQRQSNELTTLPFTYFCSGYYEALHSEQNSWVIKELTTYFH